MFTEKTIKVPEVTDFVTGEVLKPAYEYKIKTREDVPFRSITDLKGYEGHEIHNEPTICDSTTYTPISKLVQMIFRSPEAFAAATRVDVDDYDEDSDVVILEDPIEQMDELADLQALQQAQNASQAAKAESEHSATQATTTQGEGAQSEAVSADVAD